MRNYINKADTSEKLINKYAIRQFIFLTLYIIVLYIACFQILPRVV